MLVKDISNRRMASVTSEIQWGKTIMVDEIPSSSKLKQTIYNIHMTILCCVM